MRQGMISNSATHKISKVEYNIEQPMIVQDSWAIEINNSDFLSEVEIAYWVLPYMVKLT